MSKWEAAFRLVGVGFFVGASIVLGVAAGLWLDNKLNTRPIFAIGGLLAGIIIAFYGVYQMLLPLINRRNRENR